MGTGFPFLNPQQPATGADPGFISGSIPKIVSFGFKEVTPPSPLYIQRDDVLLVQVISSVADTVLIGGRMLLPYGPLSGQPDAPGQGLAEPSVKLGYIQQLNFGVPILAGQVNTSVFQNFTMQEGYLLSILATALTTATRGSVFVRASINRSQLTSGAANQGSEQILFADYATARQGPAWPQGRILFPTEGPGNILTPVVGNPAAGADLSFSVPTNQRWRLASFAALYTIANAGVARIIRVLLKNAAGAVVWQASAQQSGAVNTAPVVSAAPGQFTSVVDTTSINLPLPAPCLLGPGYTVATSTLNINATDQYSTINVSLESWEDLG